MARALAFLALACLAGGAAAGKAVQKSEGEDRKITEVVKLLQELLEKSKAEGDTERNLFAKYKCYCDTNEAKKKAEIDSLNQEISILEAKIEELQASSGQLSKQVARLDKDMKQNEHDRTTATAIREKENAAFLAQEADLVSAIDQMKNAVKTLAEVGADQSLSVAADHTKYMAGFEGSLIKLKSSVNSALLAASAFVTQKQVAPVNAFLQAPFTGSYSARSGEVVGILKSMRDTFKANLAAAREAEARAKEAYDKYMKEMKEAYDEMKKSYEDKQGQLGDNDDDLAAKRSQLDAAQTQLAEAEDFLSKLVDMCAAKSKQYEERVALRAQEDAALSEAISILFSDEAFATFGTVSATSSGVALIQLRRSTIRVHRQHAAMSSDEASFGVRRLRAQTFLQAAQADTHGAPLLTRILAMLQANNPFKTVVEEIGKMLHLIEEEEKADVQQKEWCDKEREDTNEAIDEAKNSIRELENTISELNNTIHDPSTGLLVQIDNTEESLTENYNNQVSETKDRTEESTAYQKDIANLVEAAALVDKAIHVLTKYYATVAKTLEAPAFVQVAKSAGRDDPAPPETWEDTYKGQSAEGSHSAIEMLGFLLKNTQAEEKMAQLDELAAQHDYEDSMQGLKSSEAELQETLVNLKATLAEKAKELQMKNEDLVKTQAEFAALEAYLLKIKPGCEFITTHLEMRQGARTKETASLTSAKDLLKGSAVYKQAEEASHQETLGECKDICNEFGEANVKCMACLAKVTVPGYCAGHPAAEGC